MSARWHGKTWSTGLLGLLVISVAIGALPAVAAAQTPNDPDSYLFPRTVNGSGDPLPEVFGPANGTTIGAGEQPFNLFDPPNAGDGPDENLGCGASPNTVWFGATEWWDFFPHRDGVVAIRVVGDGFRPVVAIFPYDDNAFPIESDYRCLDANAATGVVAFTYPFFVSAGGSYSIQVGGARTPNTPGGTPGEGDYTLELFYDPDTDGDGLLDSQDQCPAQAGPANLGGCPDSDGDGIADRNDRCPAQAGPAQHNGCPDSDGDGIANPDDRCPTQGGPAQLQGCSDSDGDGRADIDDRCPNTDASARDKNRDGCLDTRLLHRLINVTLNVEGIDVGVVMHSFVVKGVPKGARVVVTCRRPNGRRCGGVRIRKASSADVRAEAARRVPVPSLRNARLSFGTRITVRVTAAGSTGKYIRLTVVRGGSRIARIDRCTNPGSNRLLKRGCG